MDDARPLPEPDRALLPLEAQALLAGLDKIGERVDTFSKRVGDVEQVNTRTNRLATWIVRLGIGFGAAFVLLLAAFLAALLFAVVPAVHRANRASAKAETAIRALDTAANNAKVQCLAGNDFRRGERQLWEGILSGQFTSSTSTTTPAQKAEADRIAAAFRQFLDRLFALRDCDSLPGTAPPTTPPPTLRPASPAGPSAPSDGSGP